MFKNPKFVVQTVYHIFLTIQLSLVVASESLNTRFKSVSSSFEVLNSGNEGREVPFVHFMGFNFLLVSFDDPVSDAQAHLLYLISSLLLNLYLLVLLMLSVFSLLSMLLVLAEFTFSGCHPLLLRSCSRVVSLRRSGGRLIS